MNKQTATLSTTFVLEWLESIVQGRTIDKDVDPKKIEDIYCNAYTLYQAQQYQESSYFFYLLVWVSPLQAKFWKGLGGCLQAIKEYQRALDSYISCQALSLASDPYLLIHQADCYFALKNKEKGLHILEEAYEIGQLNKDRKIIQHVHLMRELWTKKNFE